VLVAKARHNRGLALDKMGNTTEANNLFESIAEQFWQTDCSELKEQVIHALAQEAALQARRGNRNEANEIYDRILDHYADDPDEKLKEHLDRVRFNRGFSYHF
jgi:tetratricopeptide (TPR) repeat protein